MKLGRLTDDEDTAPGGNDPEDIPPSHPTQHTHQFTGWQFDNTYHRIGCVGCGIRTDVAYHTFVNGRCSVCGYISDNDDVEYVPEDEPVEIDVPTEGKYIEDEEENITG